MSRARVILGKTGEDLACQELERRGYEILSRRYRCRRGELDIVARDGATLVFIEVKARRSVSCGGPADAITAAKRRQIVRVARDYLARRRIPTGPIRFDVVAVRIETAGPVIEVYRHAFDASLA